MATVTTDPEVLARYTVWSAASSATLMSPGRATEIWVQYHVLSQNSRSQRVKPFGVKSSVSISALVDRFLGTVGRTATEPGSGEDSKVLSAAIHSIEFFSGISRALPSSTQRIIRTSGSSSSSGCTLTWLSTVYDRFSQAIWRS